MLQTNDKTKLDISNVIEFLTYGFSIFLYLKLFIFTDELTLNAILGLWGALVFLLNLVYTKEIRILDFTIFSCLLLGMIIDVLYVKNASIYEPLWIFCYFGVYLSLKNKLLKPKFILYISCFYFIIIIIMSFLNKNPNKIFNGSSRNGISAVGVFLLSLYYLSAITINEHIYKFPILLLFYVCLWSTGRSALLVSVLWVIALMFINPSDNKFEIDKKFIISVFIFIIAFYIFTSLKSFYRLSLTTSLHVDNIYQATSISNVGAIDHLESSGTKSERFTFWYNYLAFIASNPKALILGASRLNNPKLFPYGENLHSFLFMLHSKTGLFGFIPVVFLLVRAFVKLVKEKRITVLLVFCMFGLRALFDWLGFFASYDILFYFIMFSENKDLFQDKSLFNFSKSSPLIKTGNK